MPPASPDGRVIEFGRVLEDGRVPPDGRRLMAAPVMGVSAEGLLCARFGITRKLTVLLSRVKRGANACIGRAIGPRKKRKAAQNAPPFG